MSEKPEQEKETPEQEQPSEGSEGTENKEPEQPEGGGEQTGEEKPEEKGEEQPEGEEDPNKVVDNMLSDGTPASKEINVKYGKYKDVNEKAKLYEQFAPTLAKLQEKTEEDPEYLDKLMQTEEKGDVKTRLEQLEQERKEEKKREVKQNVTEAYNLWGKKFSENWKGIQPMVDQLQKQGLSHKEALQRATYAVVPDLISENKRLIRQQQASQYQNEQGKVSGQGGQSYAATQEKSDYNMSDGDKMFAARAGIDPNLYKKHASFLKEKGLDQF